MFTNRRAVRIEWGDCDPAGIVYYPRFFEFFDASTAALFEEAGLPKQQLLSKYGILGIPMVDTQAKFLAPATFGDTVEIESRIADWGNSSFTVEHKMYKDGMVIAEGFEKRVWTVKAPAEKNGIKSRPIPAEVKERFR